MLPEGTSELGDFRVLPLNYRLRRGDQDSNLGHVFSIEVTELYAIPAELLFFQLLDIVYHRLGPSVNTNPVFSADAILVGSNVQHVSPGSDQRVSDIRGRLLISQDDNPVISLACGQGYGPTGVGSMTKDTVSDLVVERESSARSDKACGATEGDYVHIFADFPKKHSQRCRRVSPGDVGFSRNWRSHRSGGIDTQDGFPSESRSRSQALEHRLLQFGFEAGSVLCCRDESERKHPLYLHLAKSFLDRLLIYPNLLHVTQVAKQSQRAQLVLGQKTGPSFLFVGSGAESNLPGVRNSQSLVNDLLEEFVLSINWTSVSQKQNVTEFNRRIRLLPLGELVLVELGESRRETLLDLSREGLLAILSVNRQKFRQFVWTLDSPNQSRAYQGAGVFAWMTCQFPKKEQRHMSKFHLLAGFDSDLGDLLRIGFQERLLHIFSMGYAIYVEAVFSEHRGQNQPTKFLRFVESCRNRPFVGTGQNHRCCAVQSHIVLQLSLGCH